MGRARGQARGQLAWLDGELKSVFHGDGERERSSVREERNAKGAGRWVAFRSVGDAGG